jgi:hypothetical protein
MGTSNPNWCIVLYIIFFLKIKVINKIKVENNMSLILYSLCHMKDVLFFSKFGWIHTLFSVTIHLNLWHFTGWMFFISIANFTYRWLELFVRKSRSEFRSTYRNWYFIGICLHWNQLFDTWRCNLRQNILENIVSKHQYLFACFVYTLKLCFLDCDHILYTQP